MLIEKDYMNHSYKIEYVIGLEKVISYLDFKCSSDEYDKWVEFHIKSIRERLIDHFTKSGFSE